MPRCSFKSLERMFVALCWAGCIFTLWNPFVSAIGIACRPWTSTTSHYGLFGYYVNTIRRDGNYTEEFKLEGFIATIFASVVATTAIIWLIGRSKGKTNCDANSVVFLWSLAWDLS